MMVIGLTGGIASGKSTVAGMLRRAKVPVIDADELSRRVTEKGSPALQEIVETFGSTILAKDESLDRAKLAALVFSDEKSLEKLESIVHPKIAELFKRELEELRNNLADVVVYMAPLIFEKNLHRHLTKTILITAPTDVRIERMMTRDGLTISEAKNRLASQFSDEKRIPLADEVIENNGTLHQLEENLFLAWRRLTGKSLPLQTI